MTPTPDLNSYDSNRNEMVRYRKLSSNCSFSNQAVLSSWCMGSQVHNRVAPLAHWTSCRRPACGWSPGMRNSSRKINRWSSSDQSVLLTSLGLTFRFLHMPARPCRRSVTAHFYRALSPLLLQVNSWSLEHFALHCSLMVSHLCTPAQDQLLKTRVLTAVFLELRFCVV